jgi:hypothetical protein
MVASLCVGYTTHILTRAWLAEPLMCHEGHERATRTSLARVAATLCLLAWAAPAWAQAPEPKGLVPPLVEHHHEAIYPAPELAANKHAEVVLFVTIDTEGHVTQVTMKFDPNGTSFTKANSFAAYLAYSAASGGHMNADGECEIRNNFTP